VRDADPSPRSSAEWTTLLALLIVASLVAGLVFIIPLLPCPACDGKGTIRAVDTSDPDWQKGPKKLVDVACPWYHGRSRVTPYRRWTWRGWSLSDR
jgi:hypothetical protein